MVTGCCGQQVSVAHWLSACGCLNSVVSFCLCSHKDLAKDAAPHFRKAKKYYDALAAEMVSHGHICDIFCAALDNVSGSLGLTEHQGSAKCTYW